MLSQEGVDAGEEIAEGMGDAADAIEGITGELNAANVAMGAYSVAGLAFIDKASEAAMLYEANVGRLAMMAGDSAEMLLAGIRNEVERTNRVFTEGQLSEYLMPLVAMLPGQSDIVLSGLRQIDDLIIAMGGDAHAAEYAYLMLMSAIGTGTPTTVMKPSPQNRRHKKLAASH